MMAIKKARVIVCTDISSLIGGWREPDDTQSLVRLLLYTNELDIEGLIATNTHGEIHPEYIEAMVRVYGKVEENLRLHDSEFPSAGRLLSCVKAGNSEPGIESLGETGDTDGSNWIISVVDNPDPRPVWLLFWGGPNELAQALWRVEKDRGKEGVQKFISKIRVHAIGDQDNTGPWIKEKYPDLFYITSSLVFRGMYVGGDTSLVSWDWTHAHIRGKGPLGAAYPNYYGGDAFGGPPNHVQGIKEGDTPSFLYLVQNGLSDPMHPEWGSWGGRFTPTGIGNQYRDAQDIDKGEPSSKATVYRWRSAFQADFITRLNWTIKPYSRTNHPPQVDVEGDIQRIVAPGDPLSFDASGTTDRDHNNLSFYWEYDRDASTWQGRVPLEGNCQRVCKMIAPEVEKKEMIHILLTVTDDGEPPLSRYKRITIIVDPN